MDNIPLNPEDYRRWWHENTSVSYGYCWCGCGQKTSIAKQNHARLGYVRDEPKRYVYGHGPGRRGIRDPELRRKHRAAWERDCPHIPYGYCWCGCGERTTISPDSSPKMRRVEGEPIRYRKGHSGRKRVAPVPDEKTGCWNWTGPTTGADGYVYGIIRRNGTATGAHRYYYETQVGPIPDGYHIHHRCHNTICVNPDHLEAVTPAAHTRLRRSHKLTLDDARKIRRLIREGVVQQRLAEMFDVSPSQITDIKNGVAWKDC